MTDKTTEAIEAPNMPDEIFAWGGWDCYDNELVNRHWSTSGKLGTRYIRADLAPPVSKDAPDINLELLGALEETKSAIERMSRGIGRGVLAPLYQQVTGAISRASSYKPAQVDVENLKKTRPQPYSTNTYTCGYVDGWNDCIDYLHQRNMLREGG